MEAGTERHTTYVPKRKKVRARQAGEYERLLGMAVEQWWRNAVVYQIYPRSFADGDGDGLGDIPGMTSRLAYLADLGVDAVWVSPWYPSPMHDGGYDVSDYRDIAPEFGSLADAIIFIARAHQHGLRVIIDLVPNHCSWEHPWFQAALADPDAPERDLFWFRPGRGPDGAEPPTNWTSLFGGPAWTRTTNPDGTPGDWYLHLFDTSQPDWNWHNPAVVEEFDDIIRFWFDRGFDGFRVDVADAMAKNLELEDAPVDPVTGTVNPRDIPGAWNNPGLVEIQRRWRSVSDEYARVAPGPRAFVAEAYLDPIEDLVQFVSDGRLHTTFNFNALESEWSASSQRYVIRETLEAHESVGAPATWVLGNHDNVRVATRYGKPVTGVDFASGEEPEEPIVMANRLREMPTDIELGRRRARAAALLELALPGGAYIYQGEELGLDEVEDIPEELLQDPTWKRSGYQIRGRDGCRVPLPWSGDAQPFGFVDQSEPHFGTPPVPWLPQPAHWADMTVEKQGADPSSTLWLYRNALTIRRQRDAFVGDFAWHELDGGDVLAFTRTGERDEIVCVVNFGSEPIELPDGEVLVASAELDGKQLPSDTAAWVGIW